MIGKRFIISGMHIEIIADEGEQWQIRNLTTGQTLLFDKNRLDQAVRLGKAEAITNKDDTE